MKRLILDFETDYGFSFPFLTIGQANGAENLLVFGGGGNSHGIGYQGLYLDVIQQLLNDGKIDGAIILPHFILKKAENGEIKLFNSDKFKKSSLYRGKLGSRFGITDFENLSNVNKKEETVFYDDLGISLSKYVKQKHPGADIIAGCFSAGSIAISSFRKAIAGGFIKRNLSKIGVRYGENIDATLCFAPYWEAKEPKKQFLKKFVPLDSPTAFLWGTADNSLKGHVFIPIYEKRFSKYPLIKRLNAGHSLQRVPLPLQASLLYALFLGDGNKILRLSDQKILQNYPVKLSKAA